jgi:polar amino acid transport system permease protein
MPTDWTALLVQLWPGLVNTLGIAVWSLALSLVLGLAYAVLSFSEVRLVRWLLQFWLEAMRAVPLLVWLFLWFFALPLWTGVDLGGFWSAVLVFSLWGATEVGEVIRGALLSLPKAQWEAGASLGLSWSQQYRYVILPQLVRRTLPPLINVATRLIKTTSLTFLIGVVELTKAGQQIIERDGNALLIYGLLFILYFSLCYPLSYWSGQLEKRWSQTP